MIRKRLLLPAVTCLASICTLYGQTIRPIKYGNFDTFTVRYIEESKLLGGKTKTLYVVGPNDTIYGNKAYQYGVHTPWSCSNAYANILGIAKGACSAQPERRETGGYCMRLDTKMETVVVARLVDISVAVAGTLFLGETLEPVRNANDPYKKINMGIPFKSKPKAIMFDYKCRISPEQTLTKALGLSTSTIEGHDEAEVYIYLQKRWEDEDGNIYAKRIGTMRHRFVKDQLEWVNDFTLPIHYGDITQRSDFKKYQGLFPDGGQFNAKNKEGKMVPIQEVGWGDPDETPTHIILMITSGSYPAFYGHIGNAFWIDNVRFVY